MDITLMNNQKVIIRRLDGTILATFESEDELQICVRYKQFDTPAPSLAAVAKAQLRANEEIGQLVKKDNCFE